MALVLLLAGTAFGQATRDAATVLRDVSKSAMEAVSLKIAGTIAYSEPNSTTTYASFVLLMKPPNETRFEEAGGPTDALIVCDGSNVWTYSPPLDLYRKAPASENAICSPIVADWKALATNLESPVLSGTCGTEPPAKSGPYELVRGSSKPERPSAGRIKRKLCIDPSRNTIVWERTDTSGSVRTYTYRTVDLNPLMPSDAFVFRPPRGSAPTNFNLPLPQRPGSPDMVREPDTVTPRLLKKKEPEYDEISRRAGIQGAVLLYAIVGIDGVPSAVRVFRPLTPELDAQAVRAVRQWRFAPGTVKGQPSPVAVTIQVRFRMR